MLQRRYVTIVSPSLWSIQVAAYLSDAFLEKKARQAVVRQATITTRSAATARLRMLQTQRSKTPRRWLFAGQQSTTSFSYGLHLAVY